MKRFLMVIAVTTTALAGCATSTGIVKISEDTYMLGKQDGSARTAAEVKVGLYKDANAFCEKDGKKFVQVSNTGTDWGAGTYASAELQFKCQ